MPGFEIIDGILETSEVSVLAGSFQMSQRTHSRAGARHLMAWPIVAKVARDERLVAIAHRYVGPGAIPFRATLFDKSPANNWLVAWHQDLALPLRERRHAAGWGPWLTKHGVAYAHAPVDVLTRVVALRLSLDDSDHASGCLRVLPDTHLLGRLSEDDIASLTQERQAVDCIVPSGGILVMRPLILHASSKTLPGRRRRVLHIEYAASLDLGNGMQLALT